MSRTYTAAVLVIGNEILSGRTRDANVGFLGNALNETGIRLSEVRIVSDDEPEIVAALNALRARYDYVFTTGGIGPTHDDITADAVAAAFGIEIDHHPAVYKLLKDAFEARGMEANEARMRMARIPVGATLIENEASIAPGFQVENVFVLAGVPRIAQSMYEAVRGRLQGGAVAESRSIRLFVGEGTIAAPFAQLQDTYPNVEMGSYPWSQDGQYGTNLVLRSVEIPTLDEAADAVFKMAEELGGKPVRE